jgi:GntR family transcriptional regulator/MocR family aminotransferase
MPCYRQIYQGVRAAILDGRLGQGQRLPSTRTLASELGVSRLPVLNAYDQLLHEGYLVGRVGAGTYVAPSVIDAPERVTRSIAGPRPRASNDRGRHGHTGTDLVASPSLGAFRVGLPALDQFPRQAWSRLVSRHARQLPAELMAYGRPGGHLPLRDAVAAYLRAARGVRCEPDQVLIVGGSQMALRLCASVLLTSNNLACVENPGYPGAWSALAATGGTIRGVPVDEGGLVVRALERQARARLAYVTPSHQYPLGMAMAASRRLELLEWARRHNAWIIEDDYDSEYRFTSRPLGALQGMDGSGRVIYVGTFSKVLFPALRLGYLVVPHSLLARFLRHRDAFDLFSPTLYQSALTDFIAEGHFARHVRRMRSIYRQRRDALVEALHRRLRDQLEIVNADAGMHLCACFRDHIDDVAVVQRAAERGLSPLALSTCFVDSKARSGLVLGFGGSTETQIDRAVDALAEVIDEVRFIQSPNAADDPGSTRATMHVAQNENGDRIMTLRKKLNVKDGMKLKVVAKPAGLNLDDLEISRGSAGGVLLFVKTLADAEATCDPVIEAARGNRLAWIAYPKARQMGTDLNRDILRKRLSSRGLHGVRQVAIDDVWSAMRFRPN